MHKINFYGCVIQSSIGPTNFTQTQCRFCLQKNYLLEARRNLVMCLTTLSRQYLPPVKPIICGTKFPWCSSMLPMSPQIFKRIRSRRALKHLIYPIWAEFDKHEIKVATLNLCISLYKCPKSVKPVPVIRLWATDDPTKFEPICQRCH